MKIVVEAESVKELRRLLEEITGWGTNIRTVAASQERPTSDKWEELKRSATERVRQVIEIFERHGGRIGLRELEAEAGLPSGQFRGVLSHVQRAGKRMYGVDLILPQRWTQGPSGVSDREYVLNPDIYSPSA